MPSVEYLRHLSKRHIRPGSLLAICEGTLIV
jgi:hypothetical protein